MPTKTSPVGPVRLPRNDGIEKNMRGDAWRWLDVLEKHAISSIVLIATALILPFAAKPFHVDDPMYVWAGQHILQGGALDFYGFTATWAGFELPMFRLMQNPPLTSYFIALVYGVAGQSEVALHLAFFVPAMLLAIGTWRLARDHCQRPSLAAILTLTMPVFLVSATTVMADIIMVCCWVWAIYFWQRGLVQNRWRFLWMGAALAALACIAKYPAVNLLPLLAAFALIRRSPLKYLIALLLPVAALLAYEWVTSQMYGSGLLTEAIVYARHVRSIRSADPVLKLFITLCFAGGCLAPALILSPLLWGRRGLMASTAVFTVIAVVLVLIAPAGLRHLVVKEQIHWPLLWQLALWCTVGVGVVASCVLDVWRDRSAFSIVLALWILGTIAFAGVMNWSVNARTLLPMAPAVAILLVRQLESRNTARRQEVAKFLPAAVLISALLAMAVSWADFTLARAGKRAAQSIFAAFGDTTSSLWFQGHWGFQFYMQDHGARPFIAGKTPVKAGDLIAIPLFGANAQRLDERYARTIDDMEVPVCSWISTLNPAIGAGFYSDAAGPLPFVFGAVPNERYLIQRVNAPPAQPQHID